MKTIFTIPETTIVIQEAVTGTGTEVEYLYNRDDEGSVLASWNFAGKHYSDVCLWDAQTSPTYDEINSKPILLETIQERIIEIIKQK